MRSKRTAFGAAAFVVASWCAAGGAASADPHGPPPGPTPRPSPASAPGSAPKTTIDHDGTYTVGTDVAPGTYTSAGPVQDGTCYWKRLGSASNNDIIDNSMSKKPQVVQIAPTDKAFKTDGCQPWQKNDAANPDAGKPPSGGSLLDIIGAIVNGSQQQASSGQQPPKP